MMSLEISKENRLGNGRGIARAGAYGRGDGAGPTRSKGRGDPITYLGLSGYVCRWALRQFQVMRQWASVDSRTSVLNSDFEFGTRE